MATHATTARTILAAQHAQLAAGASIIRFMQGLITESEHVVRLGKLVANFQSLEFVLRAFLQQLPTAPPMGLPSGTDIYTFPVGSQLPENELTNYDPLRELITKFNSEMERRGSAEHKIDVTLVDIRDALAHGRVSAPTPTGEMRLLKFSRPDNGRVRVEFNAILNGAWFSEQIRRVCDAIETVHRYLPT